MIHVKDVSLLTWLELKTRQGRRQDKFMGTASNKNLDKSRVSGRKGHYSEEPQSRDQATGQFTHKFEEPLRGCFKSSEP